MRFRFLISESMVRVSSSLFALLWILVAGIPVSAQFRSLYGNFSIALPENPNLTRGVRNLEAPDRGVGMIYAWNGANVVYTVLYLDPLERSTEPFSTDEKARTLEENNQAVRDTVRRYEGKIISEKPIVIGALEGSEIRATIGSGELVARNFVVGRRGYSIQAVIGESERAAEAMTAISSFKIIDGRAELERIESRLVPPPLSGKLPKKRLRSDLDLAGLKGKVASVIVEIEDLTGEANQQGRILAGSSKYDERGFQTSEMETTASGIPIRVIAFGHHRGRKAARIAQFGKSDPNAIDYFIGQKFDRSGRIVETVYTDPQGKLKTTTTYTYGDNWTEAVMTGEKGEMLAKKREVLDERGNAVEASLQNSEKGPQDRTVLTYERFDEHGNWTERTEFEEVTDNGKITRVPVMRTFRTITFHTK